MRFIFLVTIPVLVLLVALLCSEWYVEINSPQILFKSATISQSDSLNLIPVHFKNIALMECYFDKDDYYSLVAIDGGGVGYLFDNEQNYVHRWRFDFNKISLSAVYNRFECFMFVLQFGK